MDGSILRGSYKNMVHIHHHFLDKDHLPKGSKKEQQTILTQTSNETLPVLNAFDGEVHTHHYVFASAQEVTTEATRNNREQGWILRGSDKNRCTFVGGMGRGSSLAFTPTLQEISCLANTRRCQCVSKTSTVITPKERSENRERMN